MCWWALRRSAWISRLHSPTRLALEDTTRLFYLHLIRMSNPILAYTILEKCNGVGFRQVVSMKPRKLSCHLHKFIRRKAGTGDHECMKSFS